MFIDYARIFSPLTISLQTEELKSPQNNKKMDSAKKLNQSPIYGKINTVDLEDQSTTTRKLHQNKPSKPFIIFITISTLIAIAIICIMSTSPSSSPSTLLNSNSTDFDSIKLICNVTRYPDTCFKSISSSSSTIDPESIFKLSLQIAVSEISTISSLIGTASLNATLLPAVKDCKDLLADAVSSLNESVTVMTVGAGEKMLTEKKVGDIQTWVSAALTDQETCTDGLEDLESTVVIDFKIKVEKSKEYVSNALAILANIVLLLDKFGQTLH